MKYSAAIIAAAAVAVSAQSLDYFPECARPCMTAAAKASKTCTEFDYYCQCNNIDELMGEASGCVLGGCGLAKALAEVYPAYEKFCAEAIANGPAKPSTTEKETLPPTTTPEETTPVPTTKPDETTTKDESTPAPTTTPKPTTTSDKEGTTLTKTSTSLTTVCTKAACTSVPTGVTPPTHSNGTTTVPPPVHVGAGAHVAPAGFAVLAIAALAAF